MRRVKKRRKRGREVQELPCFQVRYGHARGREEDFHFYLPMGDCDDDFCLTFRVV